MKKKEPETHPKETPAGAKPSAAPEAPQTPARTDSPGGSLDKICRIISADDETMLAKIQSEIESLRKAVQEREEFLKLLQRVQADFLNYQKRIKGEKECWEKYQDAAVLKELLPALENLDRTLQVKCESKDAKCILDGVDLTKREIMRVLEKRGITRIKTVGQPFDPSLHEALGVLVSTAHPAGIIMEEVRPGFMLYDRVIRPAQVKISAPPPPAPAEKPAPPEPPKPA